MAVSDVMVLPLPDSPTTASTSPRSTEKETPRTALTVPFLVLKSTTRFSTFRAGTPVDSVKVVLMTGLVHQTCRAGRHQ